MSYQVLTLSSFFGLFVGCFLAGGFASMLGLGGGFVLVPLLTIFFKVPMHAAIGTSLLCIVGTSQSVALAKPSNKYTNLRLGITLESSTIFGVIIGGIIATSLPPNYLQIIFGVALSLVFLLFVKRAFSSSREEKTDGSEEGYEFKRENIGFGILGSLAGGIFSAMLGVGGGVIKVPVLRLIMKVPFRVAVGTSNFMIGITAAAGAAFYIKAGYFDPGIVFPCLTGIVLGAYLGGNLGPKIKSSILEKIFVLVLGYLAYRMLMTGIKG